MKQEQPAAVVKAETLGVPPGMAAPPSGNHVYFNSFVDSDKCQALMQQLRECDRNLRRIAFDYDLADAPAIPIYLHIQSYGGDLLVGLGMIDQLKAIKSPIHSIIEGYCCSAATLISMACTRRFITPNSYMLIHQFTSFVWGTYEQFKDDMVLQNMLIEQLVEFYSKRSDTSKKDVRKMLKHDTWLNAAQAFDRGFVDMIHEV
jgi:ATP-dependent protease ClpP protease subunit